MFNNFISINIFTLLIFVSPVVIAAQQSATYSKATGDTVGVFKNCKIGKPCRIKASTEVLPAIRYCQLWDAVPPMVRSLQLTEEARNLGINVTGTITIFPGQGAPSPMKLSVGEVFSQNNVWGTPNRCGQQSVLWPISDISVTFTRPISKNDLPVRVLAFGRGRPSFIQGFDSRMGRGRAAANIVINGSLIDDSPEIIVPSCSVTNNANIDHGKHTPQTIIGNISYSTPVTIQCNNKVTVNVNIKGSDLLAGKPKNWTSCGFGACEINIREGESFTVNNRKDVVFTSTWHSLGRQVQEGMFTGSAIAELKFN
ncbi:UNVERIFIED_ORG: hypothetical protein FHT99_4947 [Citrobacter freundii]